jgi:hypothetical protein
MGCRYSAPIVPENNTKELNKFPPDIHNKNTIITKTTTITQSYNKSITNTSISTLKSSLNSSHGSTPDASPSSSPNSSSEFLSNIKECRRNSKIVKASFILLKYKHLLKIIKTNEIITLDDYVSEKQIIQEWLTISDDVDILHYHDKFNNYKIVYDSYLNKFNKLYDIPEEDELSSITS